MFYPPNKLKNTHFEVFYTIFTNFKHEVISHVISKWYLMWFLSDTSCDFEVISHVISKWYLMWFRSDISCDFSGKISCDFSGENRWVLIIYLMFIDTRNLTWDITWEITWDLMFKICKNWNIVLIIPECVFFSSSGVKHLIRQFPLLEKLIFNLCNT